jgi:hypothetical protein
VLQLVEVDLLKQLMVPRDQVEPLHHLIQHLYLEAVAEEDGLAVLEILEALAEAEAVAVMRVDQETQAVIHQPKAMQAVVEQLTSSHIQAEAEAVLEVVAETLAQEQLVVMVALEQVLITQ